MTDTAKPDVEERVAVLERELASLQLQMTRFTFAVTAMVMPEDADKIYAEMVEKFGQDAMNQMIPAAALHSTPPERAGGGVEGQP